MSMHRTSGSVAQTWVTVVLAEASRALGSTRFRLVTLIAAGCSLLAGLGIVLFIDAFDEAGTVGVGDALPLAIEVAGAVLAVGAGLAALSRAARETLDGTVLSSLLLVPNRRRLLLARAVAPTVLIGAASLVTSSVLVLIVLTRSGSAGVVPSRVALGVAAVALTVSLTVWLSFMTGTALRRGAVAMLIAMATVLVLPLAVGVLQLVGPAQLRGAADWMMSVLPGTAIIKSLSVSSTATEGWGAVASGLAVLAGWTAGVGLLGYHRFQREGARAE